jgi:hypothetical protein
MRYIKKPKPVNNDFTILFDDREKHPWSLHWAMKKTRLKTGDYTIEGFEDKICIEKKSGLSELLQDLNGQNRQTFIKFLNRMSKLPIKALVVEEELKSSLVFAKIALLNKKSKGRSQLTPQTIWFWTSEMMAVYGIPVLFVDKVTKKYVLPSLFKAAYKRAQEI